jgi:hypothetical protein
MFKAMIQLSFETADVPQTTYDFSTAQKGIN